MVAAVSALWVYPVKSCRGIALDRSAVEARGLRRDRRWMVVDANGRFVTQRTASRLALVEVALEEDALVLRVPPAPIAAGSPATPNSLASPALPASDADALRLPYEGAVPTPRRLTRRVTVWASDVDAVDCGDAARDFMTRWLGFPASLVYMDDDARRPVKPAYARPDDIVSFADGFPLLVASTASLADLNTRLAARAASPVPMDRFRPNIVVSGTGAWEEDGWTRILVGDVPVRIAKPCERCVITTIDQRTTERSVEPLRTLAEFRRRGNDVLFAQNGVPEGAGSLAVGDAVTVVEGA